jgi:type II restriction enzyme
MDLMFNVELAKGYRSNSQIARVLSEDWVLRNSYCPNCGNHNLNIYNKNNPAADFYCRKCESDFELKSFRNIPPKKVVDGAYDSMFNKILSNRNPNLFFLQYSPGYSVLNYFTIPKHFFTIDIIEKRKPLSKNARRANWTGCNILFGNLPQSSIIYIVKDSMLISPETVLQQWERTSFLIHKKNINRGWLIEVIGIIDKIPSEIFTIVDVYKFEEFLRHKYPGNRFIKAKVRQQLQVLRDKGLIKFIGNGVYQKGG